MRSSHVLLTLTLSLSLSPAAGRADASGRSRLLANGTGKTVIRKVILGNDMTVAILSRAGTAVVADPMNMPPGVVPDVVTVSHRHHLDKELALSPEDLKGTGQRVIHIAPTLAP